MIAGKGGETELAVDVAAKDEASKEIGQLIIEAMERGGKEKKLP